MMRRMLPPALTLALTLLGASAWGHDPDTPYADWMESLFRPDYPMSSCCGRADQYYVREYRATPKSGVAFAAIVLGNHGRPDFAVEIPPEKVIWNRVNPTGRGIIFITDNPDGKEVLCFVPGLAM